MIRTINCFRKSHSNAVIPTQEEGNAGWDLYAVEDIVLEGGCVTNVNTGLQLARAPLIGGTTEGLWSILMKIEGRSGLASKGIFPVGGIIDGSYRGDVGVCLYNSKKGAHEESGDYFVRAGDRIAQLVLYPVIAKKINHHVEFQEVDWQEESNRGNRGFGASGR